MQIFLSRFIFLVVLSSSFFAPDASSILLQKFEDLSERLSIPNERYVLDNGLTVILSQDHHMPFVAVNLWYQVGAVNELYNKTGLAHLFEHLMFEGSRHIKASEHFRLMENAGGYDVNASTSFDRTNYFQTVPKSHLELALSAESSRMFFLAIDQAKLDEQRKVVRREREQRFESLPYGLAALKLWQSIFPPKHPFHGRVIGSHRDLEDAELLDVQGFYDKYYGPSNASLALVGDFGKPETKALINKYFGSLPRNKVMRTPVLPKVTIGKQEILREDEKLGQLPLIRIQYITPALYASGDAELDVVAHILTGGAHGRLTKAITRDKNLASSTSAYQQSFQQLSVFTIDALLVPEANTDEVIQEIDKVLTGLSANPVTPTEIDRARNAIFTNQFFALQDIGGQLGRAELLQSYNRFANNPDFLKSDVERYRKLNQQSISQTAKQYLPAGMARKILIATPASNKVAAQQGKAEALEKDKS